MNKTAGIAGAIVAVAVSAGVARATVTPDTTTPVVYHACVQNYGTLSRTVSHVATTAVTCPAGTSPVSWNQTGPRGPQGLPGPSTAGPAGLDVVTVQESSQGPSASVACPASHPYVISGGGFVYGGYSSSYLTNSSPSFSGSRTGRATGWSVSDGGGWSTSEHADVFAICAR